MGAAGSVNFFLDGHFLTENNESFRPGGMFYTVGEDRLKGGPYKLRLGANRIDDPQDMIDAAAALTSASDPAIVVAGLTGRFVTEALDRQSMQCVRPRLRYRKAVVRLLA